LAHHSMPVLYLHLRLINVQAFRPDNYGKIVSLRNLNEKVQFVFSLVAPENGAIFFNGEAGASTGIELSMGGSVDITTNHDPAVVASNASSNPSGQSTTANTTMLSACRH